MFFSTAKRVKIKFDFFCTKKKIIYRLRMLFVMMLRPTTIFSKNYWVFAFAVHSAFLYHESWVINCIKIYLLVSHVAAEPCTIIQKICTFRCLLKMLLYITVLCKCVIVTKYNNLTSFKYYVNMELEVMGHVNKHLCSVDCHT